MSRNNGKTYARKINSQETFINNIRHLRDRLCPEEITEKGALKKVSNKTLNAWQRARVIDWGNFIDNV